MDAKKVVSALGGSGSVAKACKVNQQVVCNWVRRNAIPPKMVLKYPQLFLSAYMASTEEEKRNPA